jgi:hypothetical protein
MSERPCAQEGLRELREVLDGVLHALDAAELHLVALYVQMALVALDKVHIVQSEELAENNIA